MKSLLIASVLALSALSAQAVEIGLHLGSGHIPSKEYHNGANPGIYVRAENVQAGYYRNSYSRDTFYAAYVQPAGPFDLMAGLATGYQKKCERREVQTKKAVIIEETCRGFSKRPAALMAAISYAPPVELMGMRPRVYLMPGLGKASTVIHVALEWK